MFPGSREGSSQRESTPEAFQNNNKKTFEITPGTPLVPHRRGPKLTTPISWNLERVGEHMGFTKTEVAV